MKAVAIAVKEQSLLSFERAKETFKSELTEDFILKTHINNLYHNLLEDNLLKILLPYSEVQIEYVAHLIGLPEG
jgi:26S proteasome regulatory subunit N6